MAPTWPDLAPQDGPKLGPKWAPNRFQNGLGSEVGSGAHLVPIWDRFWSHFGSILGRFLADFGLAFGCFLGIHLRRIFACVFIACGQWHTDVGRFRIVFGNDFGRAFAPCRGDGVAASWPARGRPTRGQNEVAGQSGGQAGRIGPRPGPKRVKMFCHFGETQERAN